MFNFELPDVSAQNDLLLSYSDLYPAINYLLYDHDIELPGIFSHYLPATTEAQTDLNKMVIEEHEYFSPFYRDCQADYLRAKKFAQSIDEVNTRNAFMESLALLKQELDAAIVKVESRYEQAAKRIANDMARKEAKKKTKELLEEVAESSAPKPILFQRGITRETITKERRKQKCWRERIVPTVPEVDEDDSENEGEVNSHERVSWLQGLVDVEVTAEEKANELTSGLVSELEDQDFIQSYREDAKALTDGYVHEVVSKPAKYCRDVKVGEVDCINPTSDYDAYANVLKLIQATMLIQNYCLDSTMQNEMRKRLIDVYDEFRQRIELKSPSDPSYINEVHDELVNIIAEETGVDTLAAIKQLFAARDLCLKLVSPPIVQTRTIAEKHIEGHFSTHRTSQQVKVGETFFRKYFVGHRQRFNGKSEWFVSMCQNLGLNEYCDSWLRKWYNRNWKKMMSAGVPTVASLRSEPLPPGTELTSVNVRLQKGVETISRKAEWVRIGTLLMYKFRLDDKAREAKFKEGFAKDCLREILETLIKEKITAYQKLYSGFHEDSDERKKFYFSYASLLSPLWLSVVDNYFDNNDLEMVEVAKQAMKALELEFLQGEESSLFQELQDEFPGIELRFTQTNHAINYLNDNRSAFGPLTSAFVVRYEEDVNVLNDKLQWIDMLASDFSADEYLSDSVSYIKGEIDRSSFSEVRALQSLSLMEQGLLMDHIEEEIRMELVTRVRASIALRMLLNREKDFAKMNECRLALMRAGLELHAMGSQCLFLSGCKSFRERFGVASDAYTVMLENEDAMFHWEPLNEGIKSHVSYGHTLATQKYHVAGVLKISDVSKDFAMPPSPLAQSFKRNRIFIKPGFSYAKHRPAIKYLLYVAKAIVGAIVAALSVCLAALYFYKEKVLKKSRQDRAEQDVQIQHLRSAKIRQPSPSILSNHHASSWILSPRRRSEGVVQRPGELPQAPGAEKERASDTQLFVRTPEQFDPAFTTGLGGGFGTRPSSQPVS